MLDIHNYFPNLLLAIDEEEKEEKRRYSFENGQSLKDLKRSGLALHPIKINRKSFGFADYPEISFHYPFPFENNYFKGSCPIELFCPGEESIKGILLFLEGKKGELRIFAPDFPDWLEDGDTGIKLAPDARTLTIMRKALDKELKDDAIAIKPIDTVESLEISTWNNPKLNEGQKLAVSELLKNSELGIVHGPPGTGKTTTLIEAISQWVQKGKKVLVSAPSNTAVDHVASILPEEFNVLRIGNSVKVREDVFPLTPEGKWQNSPDLKNLKRLKIQAEQLRKMAHTYKRNFGKSEREQRSALFKEVNSIRKQIKDIKKSTEESWFDKAQVVLGTPVAIVDQTFDYNHFDVLVIDEAAQCLEPLAWAIFPFGQKIVLAGDPYQLPPTILSQKANDLGMNVSILERCLNAKYPVSFLPLQYRMPKNIADFSSQYFYEGRLESFKAALDSALLFYDTAGAGYDEERGDQGGSLKNEGEAEAISKIIESENLNLAKTTVLSPYSGQVAYLRDILDSKIRVSTIDSYQGQEQEIIVISLVRSNPDQEIGFLKDYRRMNVAMTRAKSRLIIVGDSATLGSDPFYAAFLEYAENQEAYKSVWELV
jgi:ATP-dependent RNA/DNA helicase IGHMBP2